MKSYKIFLFLLAITLVSCSEDFFDSVVEVDIPEHTPILAVTSYIGDQDSFIQVYVGSTVGVLENEEPKVISAAKVELLKNGTLLHDVPYDENFGFHTLRDITPLGNGDAEYTLRVSATGFESVEAVQRMPQPVAITEIEFEEDGIIDDEGERLNRITIEWTDPSASEDYYALTANGTYEFDPQTTEVYGINMGTSDPIAIENRDGILLKDVTFNGREYRLNNHTYDLYNLDSYQSVFLTVNLRSVTRDRFNYENSITAYNNSEDNPFAEPAIVFSNFKNGAGIFALESNSTKTIQLR